MRKLTLHLAFVCLAAALAVSPALADTGQQLTGTISQVSDSSITVVDGASSLTCTVPVVKNYSLTVHFHAGDVVKLECRKTDAGALAMNGLHRQGADPKRSGDQKPPAPPKGAVSHVQGKISQVSDSSITVADGGASLTCAVPAVKNYSLAAHFHVGDAVALECKQGERVLIMTGLHRQSGDHGTTTTPPGQGDDHHGTTTPAPTPPANRIGGKVSAVSDTTITVVDGGRSLTCTATGDLKPSAVFHVGDPVVLECKPSDNGTLLIVSVQRRSEPVSPMAPPAPAQPAPTTPSGDHH